MPSSLVFFQAVPFPFPVSIMYNTREYALNTSVTTCLPWGTFVTARIMCPDGVVRKVKRISITADTWFSVPCSVTVKGKTVAGYMTICDSPDSPFYEAATFRPYTYRKNHVVFNA